MNKYLILLSILFLAIPQAQAEESWLDSAKSFFGMGDEEEEMQSAPSAETMDKIETATKSMPTSMPKMADLTSMVTSQLGVSESQAQGGLGTLMSLAKTSLAGADFDKLKGYIPEMDTLLKAAPALSENAEGLSSLMGNAGKYANVLQGATAAYSQFESLGISPDQIPKYVDVTNEFLNSKGGQDASDLFKEGVNAVLAPE